MQRNARRHSNVFARTRFYSFVWMVGFLSVCLLAIVVFTDLGSAQWSDPIAGGLSILHLAASNTSNSPSQPQASQVSNAPAGTYGTSARTGFNYAKNKVAGVSLGGWLLTEPFITPSLFDATGSDEVVDEWTLSQFYGKKKAQQVLKQHWSSFYAASDFKAMAAAGLNHVRIPVGFWILDIKGSEPYVNGQMPYLQSAVMWAKANGLSVIIDLHGAAGSQNGYDNSGRRTMNFVWAQKQTNIQRTINVLGQLATEFRKAKYGTTVVAIELVNEPKAKGVQPAFFDFISNAYPSIHVPKGTMQLHQHYAYLPWSTWSSFMPSSSQFKDLVLTDQCVVRHSRSERTQLLSALDSIYAQSDRCSAYSVRLRSGADLSASQSISSPARRRVHFRYHRLRHVRARERSRIELRWYDRRRETTARQLQGSLRRRFQVLFCVQGEIRKIRRGADASLDGQHGRLALLDLEDRAESGGGVEHGTRAQIWMDSEGRQLSIQQSVLRRLSFSSSSFMHSRSVRSFVRVN